MTEILLLIAAGSFAVMACLITHPMLSNILSGIFILLSGAALKMNKKPISVIMAAAFMLMFVFFFVRWNPLSGLIPHDTEVEVQDAPGGLQQK